MHIYKKCALAVQHMMNLWHHLTVMLMMLMSSYGFSVLGLTLALEILWTTSMPLVHLPNTVCLLSSQGCRSESRGHRSEDVWIFISMHSTEIISGGTTSALLLYLMATGDWKQSNSYFRVHKQVGASAKLNCDLSPILEDKIPPAVSVDVKPGIISHSLQLTCKVTDMTAWTVNNK